MGFFGDKLRGGEEDIIKHGKKIIEIAINANSRLEALIEEPTVINEIRELEKKSDNVALEISDMIASGAIAPNLIDDFMEFVDKEDNIVDSIYNLGREFLRYKPPTRKMRHYMRARLLSISGLAESAMKLLLKMEDTDDIRMIKKYHKEIERIEEEGDDIKDGIFDYAYREKEDFKTFYHMFQLAHYADNMLDNCEDASDTLVSIMNSIVT